MSIRSLIHIAVTLILATLSLHMLAPRIGKESDDIFLSSLQVIVIFILFYFKTLLAQVEFAESSPHDKAQDPFTALDLVFFLSIRQV